INKGSAACEVAGQEHLRVLHLFGAGQKLVGEFQSVVQLQLPPTYCPLSIKDTEGENRIADLRAQLARSRIHRLQFRGRPSFCCAKTEAKADCTDSSWRARSASSGKCFRNSRALESRLTASE